ncbi:hypothetical protein FTG71_20810 [Salmonella enterica]|nr:hypothetical protein [Salmonella enterica]
MKPFISFAIKKYTVPSKDRGSPWWGWLRAGFTPEYAYSALFDHGLASKSDQRFASIRSTGNLTFSTAF